MAPRKSKGKAPAPRPSASRKTRSAANGGEPNVYDELVAEATARDELNTLDDRPLKRRRVAVQVGNPSEIKQTGNDGAGRQRSPSVSASATTTPLRKPQVQHMQTVEASDSDDSDFDFEDVDLDQTAAPYAEPEEAIQDVSVSVEPSITPTKRTPVRRKPVSASEKAHRIVVHKAHLLCLLGHCMFVNTWCNDQVVQKHLQQLLDEGTVSNITLGQSKSQFERNRWFIQGLEAAVELFKVVFTVNSSGMRKAKWAVEDGDTTTDTGLEAIDRTELARAAKSMSGSQDIGNQLFCALLRSVGVRTRLVCSLQVLPFAPVPAKSNTPQKSIKSVVFATAPTYASDGSAKTDSEDSSVGTSQRIGKIPSVKRRLGQPAFPSASVKVGPSSLRSQKRSIRRLAYPVFWVEAFNTAHQKWIAVDPVVTHTVNKPAKLEPPGAYDANQLIYAVAFEADGVARDVTRRYTKAFNAKTRQQRIESLEGGTQWWKQALRLFRRRGARLDSDQVEDAELAQKEAQEGMPNNVQDFKHHPYYALERHLRRHEVIHPRKSVGRANLGSNANPKMEAVFRRQDVLLCRSADKWYRLGRKMKKGELPLKHITTRVRAKEDDASIDSNKATALYAASQTELYVPPPVVKGKVPRNGFGNLDIYVPSMVPAGGTHIRHELARQAAQTLKIDHVDAVTGFSFKGRHGTAIIEGVVVASQYADAVLAVMEGMEHDQKEEASMKRSLIALQLWQRFLTGLRIRERVSEYGELSKRDEDIEVSADSVLTRQDHSSGTADSEAALLTAGKFSLEELKSGITPRKRKQKKNYDSDEDDQDSGVDDDHDSYADDEGGFLRDEERGWSDYGGGFMPDDRDEGGFLPDATESMVNNDAGGFLPDTPEGYEDGEDGGGGLVVDDEDDIDHDMPDEPNDGDAGVVHDEIATTQMEDFEPAGISPSDGEKGAVEGRPTASHRVPKGQSPTPAHSGERDEKQVEEASTVLKRAQNEPERVNGAATTSIAEDNVTESDHGSLLSHDPEDDDAEPDWLESD